jgi:hypothetical protein
MNPRVKPLKAAQQKIRIKIISIIIVQIDKKLRILQLEQEEYYAQNTSLRKDQIFDTFNVFRYFCNALAGNDNYKQTMQWPYNRQRRSGFNGYLPTGRQGTEIPLISKRNFGPIVQWIERRFPKP